MPYLKLITGLFSAALIVATSASSSATASEIEEPSQTEKQKSGIAVLGSAQYDSNEDDITIEVNSVDRSSTGGLTSLTYTIANHGDKESSLITQVLGKSEFTYPPRRLGSPTLLDEEGQVRYFTIMNSDNDCVCPKGGGDSGTPQHVAAGGSQPAWSSFILPDDVDTVTVEFPDFAPIKGIPVS
ncbi:hypothetical protein [Nocardiopsis rhodophaea]|uniref:hypothetical protein n=1 Tax=Nocardiopsis rhodophaea TaxID=280238 RepID=UPI0031D6AD95